MEKCLSTLEIYEGPPEEQKHSSHTQLLSRDTQLPLPAQGNHPTHPEPNGSKVDAIFRQSMSYTRFLLKVAFPNPYHPGSLMS